VWVARAGQSRALIKDAAAPAYAANHLLYLRNGVLMTHLFDPHRLELRGESTVASFAERVAANADPAPPFSAADDVLAYQAGGSALTQMVWRDRSGRELGAGEPGDYGRFSLSPDGRTLAVERAGGDVAIQDLAGNASMRLASARSPVWSPDGRWI